MMMMMIINGSR